LSSIFLHSPNDEKDSRFSRLSFYSLGITKKIRKLLVTWSLLYIVKITFYGWMGLKSSHFKPPKQHRGNRHIGSGKLLTT